MAIFERSDTFSHWVTIYDRDNTKTDPSTVSMSIIDPYGNTVLSYGSGGMTKDSTGVYYYDHDISSTATYGRYEVRVKTMSGAGSGHLGIIYDEFFIMPWKLEESVRRKMGISTNDINDDDLSHIAWMAYQESLRDVYNHHYKEKPNGNPDTGTGFNGTNTSFQTKHYPIADIGGDGSIGDSDDPESDITGWWIDNAGHHNTCDINITQSDNGEITITQDDGTTAIPSNNEGVYLDYWSEYGNYNEFVYREAVSFLAAHYVNLRFTERDKVTIADINANKPVVIKHPNRFMREYKRLVDSVRKPRILGVR